MYLRGDVLGYELRRPGGSGAALQSLLGAEVASSLLAFLQNPDTLLIASFLTVAVELSLPFTQWSRRTRPLAMAAGIPFHLSIAFLMGIQVFSYTVIASYLLFLDPRTLPRALRRLGA